MNEPDPGNPAKPMSNLPNSTPDSDAPSREEILDSMLEQTKSHLDSDSIHGKLTDYVRENRLPSHFDFENVCELVRCLLQSTKIDELPIDTEDCVTWIATCLYEDPISNERLARLWDSIVTRIQG